MGVGRLGVSDVEVTALKPESPGFELRPVGAV